MLNDAKIVIGNGFDQEAAEKMAPALVINDLQTWPTVENLLFVLQSLE